MSGAYLAVGEHGEADGTLFGEHSFDELSVVGLFHRLHHVVQAVGGVVLQQQGQGQLTAAPAREVVHGQQPPTDALPET